MAPVAASVSSERSLKSHGNNNEFRREIREDLNFKLHADFILLLYLHIINIYQYFCVIIRYYQSIEISVQGNI